MTFALNRRSRVLLLTRQTAMLRHRALSIDGAETVTVAERPTATLFHRTSGWNVSSGD